MRLESHTERDTLRVRMLNKLALSYYSYKPESTDSLASLAFELAHELGDELGKADALFAMAAAKVVHGKLDAGEQKMEQGLEIYEQLGHKKGQADAYNVLGSIRTMRGDYQTAMRDHFHALRLREELGLRLQIGTSLVNLGLLHFYQDEGEEALDFLLRGRAYYDSTTPPHLLAGLDNNLGATYLLLDSLDKAKHHFEMSLQQNLQVGNNSVVIAIEKNLGHIDLEQFNFRAAASHFRKALQMAENAGSQNYVAEVAKDLGNLYVQSKQYDSASYFLNKAHKMSQELGLREVEFLTVDKLKNLYKAKGQYKKALFYMEEKARLNDSLRGLEQKRLIAELDIQYETEQKEAQVKLLEAREAQTALETRARELSSEAELRQKNILTIAIFIGLLLVAGIALVLFLTNKRIHGSNKLLQEQKEELVRQKEALEAQNREIEQQKARLEELNREKDGLVGIVAHDLRAPLTRLDGLAQVLRLSGPLNAEQENAMAMMARVTEEGGNLIRDLLQVTAAEQAELDVKITEFDLVGFSRDLLISHEAAGAQKEISLNLSHSEATIIIQSDRDLLSRILDNLVSNALKFSNSGSRVNVALNNLENGGFSIAVRDQGPGISAADQRLMFKKFQKLSARPTAGEPSTGLGLCIVKGLAERMGGNIEVKSQLGKGSVFTVSFPASQA